MLANGARRGFCVPGESYLDLLDALYDEVERFTLVVCRNEAGAVNMAEAHGKLTGRPGLALVTRGPGATHASIGLHTAKQDATPLVIVIGDVERALRGRGAFQEIDYTIAFAPLTKAVLRLDEPERTVETVGHAFALACAGRPGPVAIVVPEDVFALGCGAPVAAARATCAVRSGASSADLDAVRAELARAERPLIVAGGGPWNAEASDALAHFAEGSALPVALEFRCTDYLNNDSPAFVGELGLGLDPAFAADVRASDTVLALGAQLNDPSTGGYSLFDVPDPAQRLVHVSPESAELGRVYRPVLALAADPRAVVAQLAEGPALASAGWAARSARLRDRALHRRAPGGSPAGAGVDLGAVVRALRARLPDDAIVATGAGNFTLWVRRYYPFRRFGTQLAPRSGAMGYGVPAAIAAKLEHPDRTVVCFSGDGDFGMAPTELATAVAYHLGIVFIVIDNGGYGTIRMHQERRFPGRPIATALRNPDFAALGRAYGAHAENVERTEDFEPAFERALAAGRPALIALRTDPTVLTPGFQTATSTA